MKKVFLVISIFFIFESFCFADKFTIFDCTIKHVYDVSDTGELEVSGWQNEFHSSKFTVERKTGVISGQTLTTILAKETSIINYGNNENSFKAIAVFPGQVQLIEIQTFKKGTTKPFVASSMGGIGIITGMCECK